MKAKETIEGWIARDLYKPYLHFHPVSPEWSEEDEQWYNDKDMYSHIGRSLCGLTRTLKEGERKRIKITVEEL